MTGVPLSPPHGQNRNNQGTEPQQCDVLGLGGFVSRVEWDVFHHGPVLADCGFADCCLEDSCFAIDVDWDLIACDVSWVVSDLDVAELLWEAWCESLAGNHVTGPLIESGMG